MPRRFRHPSKAPLSQTSATPSPQDLFQDIGPMQDARMVAVGTALATFHRQSDAVKAFKAYHGRLLDGE